jgi:hypothetical protein
MTSTLQFSHNRKIIAGNQARVAVGPPYSEPEYPARIAFNPDMEHEAKDSPLVVLVKSPEFIDPSRVEPLSFKSP